MKKIKSFFMKKVLIKSNVNKINYAKNFSQNTYELNQLYHTKVGQNNGNNNVI